MHVIKAHWGGVWSASCPGHFTPGESAPQYPANRKFGGPRVSSNILENRPIFDHHELNQDLLNVWPAALSLHCTCHPGNLWISSWLLLSSHFILVSIFPHQVIFHKSIMYMVIRTQHCVQSRWFYDNNLQNDINKIEKFTTNDYQSLTFIWKSWYLMPLHMSINKRRSTYDQFSKYVPLQYSCFLHKIQMGNWQEIMLFESIWKYLNMELQFIVTAVPKCHVLLQLWTQKFFGTKVMYHSPHLP